ncbi:MAG TPA: imidazole glycerol phosphate synthase subunit HisH, partial [Spirochaetia bacterium]|nr:imidazole glycerol phosphate synthase subunit HisH [Spirochaetia bacterium]
MKIALIDYKAGNRTSVERALSHLGIDFCVADLPAKLDGIDKIIFPGVGEAKAAMDVLIERGLDRALREAAGAGVPILGICIGCQVLLDDSEERSTPCLGIIAGRSRRFPADAGVKIPQIGWNQVYHGGRHLLFDGIPDGACFYFDHSYYPLVDNPELTVGETTYGVPFSSAFVRNNVAAVQFHPEKSGRFGLAMLKNFAAW